MLEKAVNADLIQRNVDFKKKVVHVKHSMTYFSNSEGKYVFQLHPTKTHKGLPDIPLTMKAVRALRQQQFLKQTIINKGKEPMVGFENLVFATRALERGVPLKTVSSLLGHTQLQLTTDVYMHVTQDSLFEGMAQFERAAIG